jgi:formyltetrahydrofolate deformylase
LDELQFRQAFTPLAEASRVQLAGFGRRKITVALLVSRYQHCLVDLLYRHQVGELNCSIALVISNHENAQPHDPNGP